MSTSPAGAAAPQVVPRDPAAAPAQTEVERVREAQKLLNQWFGEFTVRPDGDLGRQTRRALARFQRVEMRDRAGVQPGVLDDATMQALRERGPLGGGAPKPAAAPPSRRAQQLVRPPQGAPGAPTPPRPATAPGASVRPPTPAAAPHPGGEPRNTAYVARSGDTFERIAALHGVSPAQLRAVNPGIDVNDIRAGDTIHLPANARTPTPEPRVELRPGQPHPGAWQAPTTRSLERSRERHADVEATQRRLKALGYDVEPDGVFGPDTQEAVRAFQLANRLPQDGVIGPRTWEKLQAADARQADAMLPAGPQGYPVVAQYPPGSPQQIALFRAAARAIGAPESWASSPSLQRIIARESDGHVGRPNYTYGRRARNHAQWADVHRELRAGRIRARSSATGIGQLLLSNVDRYYPSGRAGIGNPLEEAAGMLAYIRARYGTPERAWRLYGRLHEGY